MLDISHLKGKSNKKTSNKELEKIREKAFEKIARKFK